MTAPTRYAVHYPLRGAEAWGLVITDLSGANFLGVDGTLRPGPFDAAKHLHPLSPGSPPRHMVWGREVAFDASVPAGDYLWTLHPCAADAEGDGDFAPIPDDPTLPMPMVWHHDPDGRRDAFGKPTDPVVIQPTQINHFGPPTRMP